VDEQSGRGEAPNGGKDTAVDLRVAALAAVLCTHLQHLAAPQSGDVSHGFKAAAALLCSDGAPLQQALALLLELSLDPSVPSSTAR
jgi:hypothetical protein